MNRSLSDLVAAHPLLAGLPADMSDLLAGCARNQAFGADRLLLAEGDEASAFYLIRRGRVALEVREPGFGPLTVETIGPGAVLGWSWMFPPYRWHLDARALDPVVAISVDASCLRSKATTDPAFGYQLTLRLAAVMLDRLQATRLRLLDLYGSRVS